MSDKLQNAIDKGARAAAKLQDPAFNEAVELLSRAYYDAWLSSAPGDDEGRNRLWIAATLVHKIKDQLTATMNNGKVARAQIEQIRKAA